MKKIILFLSIITQTCLSAQVDFWQKDYRSEQISLLSKSESMNLQKNRYIVEQIETLQTQCQTQIRRRWLPLSCINMLTLLHQLNWIDSQEELQAEKILEAKCLISVENLKSPLENEKIENLPQLCRKRLIELEQERDYASQTRF